MAEKEQIYITFKNKRFLKNLFPELLIVWSSLKNQTAGKFVSLIFDLNVNFHTLNSFW